MELLAVEAGFRELPACPGELPRVPAVESRERDSVPRGMHEPTVADVDAHVADLRRLRARAAVTEEDHVGGLELRQADSLRLRNLAAHLKRRPAAEHRGKVAFVGIGLELVDAPDEAGAVVAAPRRDAELRLGPVARPAPDV